MAGQPGFFDTDARLRALSAAGDPLERLRSAVDFERFRPELEVALDRADRSRGGRPPYDAVLMFRVLVLQTLYTLSDDQAEYQLRDRLSFMRFVGLALHDAVPDAKTIWLFREQLTRGGRLTQLFAKFDRLLHDRGYLAMGGAGRKVSPAKLAEGQRRGADCGRDRHRQIDRDGRWTIKRGKKAPPPEGAQRQAVSQIAVPVFGYKNHIGIDRAHGFIRRFTVTHAARHDGSQLGAVLDGRNTASDVWADTAYRSKANLALLGRRGLQPQFQRAKPRGRPMPPHIARGNATRARVRAKVEHVFAAEKRRMRLLVRSIGLARATAKITLANLAYNMRRLVWIDGRAASA